jgi:hypothetical protein
MSQLLVNFTGSRHGLGDFCAQEFAIAAPEAMHRETLTAPSVSPNCGAIAA